MNLWIDYLINKIYIDSDIIEELLDIDNNIMKTNYSLNSLYAFLNENKNKKRFYGIRKESNLEIITEGMPEVIIKICNDSINKSGIIVINKSFMGINKWITKQYMSFCLENECSNFLVPLYDDNFGNNLDNIVLIGSEAFVNELNINLGNIYQSYIEQI